MRVYSPWLSSKWPTVGKNYRKTGYNEKSGKHFGKFVGVKAKHICVRENTWEKCSFNGNKLSGETFNYSQVSAREDRKKAEISEMVKMVAIDSVYGRRREESVKQSAYENRSIFSKVAIK